MATALGINQREVWMNASVLAEAIVESKAYQIIAIFRWSKIDLILLAPATFLFSAALERIDPHKRR